MKSNKSICAFFTILLMATAAREAAAGAWTHDQGGYYFKLSGNYLSTTTERGPDGEERDLFAESENMRDGSFLDINIAAYAEYGLFSRLTLVGQLPVKYLRSRRVEELEDRGIRDFEETTVGPGDLTFGVRYAHLLQPIVLSVQGSVKLPLGYDRSPDDGGPPLGNGELDADIQLLVGRSLDPLPFYVTGSGGLRRRGGPYNDELFYQAELGYSTAQWLVKGALDIVENRANRAGMSENRSGLDDSLVGEQDYTKLVIGVERAIDATTRFTIDLIEILYGKNTIEGTTIAVGVAYSR